MLEVYACITEDHDLRLVVVAGLVCALTAFTAFTLLGRVGAAQGLGLWFGWLSAAAAVAGAGIWSTHFVAMLAFKPNMPIGYDLGLTVLSVAIAMAISWVGFAIALLRPSLAPYGGAVAGAAVGTMHYVGMAAMKIQADVHWNAGFVVASLAIGIVLGAAALTAFAADRGLRGRVQGGLLFTLGICGLHFTAMAAAVLVPIPAPLPLPEGLVEPGALALAIAAVMVFILALGLAGPAVDGVRLRLRRATAVPVISPAPVSPRRSPW